MIQNGWYCCPVCGQKLFRVETEAVCTGVLIKCKRCKREIRLSFKIGVGYGATFGLERARMLSEKDIAEYDCRSCKMVISGDSSAPKCPFEDCVV